MTTRQPTDGAGRPTRPTPTAPTAGADPTAGAERTPPTDHVRQTDAAPQHSTTDPAVPADGTGGTSPSPRTGRPVDPALAAWISRGLGVLLVLGTTAAAVDRLDAWLALLPFTLPLAWFAAPPAPGVASEHATWQAQLSRQRTTAFATGCVLTAALGDPPLPLAAGLTLLLLGYLLHLDHASGTASARSGRAAVAAVGSAVLVLVAAVVPVGRAASGPLLAVLAVAGATIAAAAAFWGRPAAPDDEGPRSQ
ncbi:hypothetical protein ACIRBX_19945 [Kitasatospora sp. NPDC096147]|uniref:hypothetical protein n=1 Tax=Kitasatospora sp. NPDC096147 TaxID=3364093 RepID=UPI0037FD4CDA